MVDLLNHEIRQVDGTDRRPYPKGERPVRPIASLYTRRRGRGFRTCHLTTIRRIRSAATPWLRRCVLSSSIPRAYALGYWSGATPWLRTSPAPSPELPPRFFWFRRLTVGTSVAVVFHRRPERLELLQQAA